MVQHMQPEAPYPPPPPHGGIHPGMQQLPIDLERMNLHQGVPQYTSQGNSYLPQVDGRYTPQGPAVNSLPSLSKGRVPITYEGWNFTKQAPSRANEKATWALVLKTKMPLSQDELRNQVAKQRKKGKSVTERYNDPDMDGFKRKQVDRLIADKTRMELDPRFEYKLASLRLEQGRTKQNSRQTTSMQAILKRVYRSGDDQPLASGQDRAQELEGEIVDLTGADEPAYSQSGYSSGSPGLYGVQPLPEYIHAQPYDDPMHAHAGYYHDQGPAVQTVHPDYVQPSPHPQEHYQQQYMPQQGPHQHPQPHHQHQEQHHVHEQHPPDNNAKKDKKDKKKDQKPEVHQKKERKHKDYSDSSSDSDAGSSLYTDRTPDTEYSAQSAHAYHEKKKGGSSRKTSRRDSRSHDRDLSPVRQVYRERYRKSPARSTHSGSEQEVYEIITSDGQHGRPYKTRTYVKEHPAFHQRALSYDDDRNHRPATRQKRLNSYAHPVLDEHPYEEKERLKWELEELRRQRSEDRREKERLESEERREKQKLESDRLERQKLELETARLKLENERRDRDRYQRENKYHRDERYDQRDRFDRNDRYDRERYDPYIERERPRRFSAAYDRRDDYY